MKKLTAIFLAMIFTGGVFALSPAPAQSVELKYSRAELIAKWRARIEKLLAQGKLPLIDFETSLKKGQVAKYIPSALPAFDEYAIAMMSPDGYPVSKGYSDGYQWDDYIIDLVNEYPDYFIPTANGGTNPNWLDEQGGKATDFIDRMEVEVRSGKYFNMGEFDFRHYMSGSQCKKGRTDRNNDIPLNGKNGHRVFKLSSETGVPFIIHLEAEDAPLDALEEMLKTYPKAKVVVAHFGQIRHPEKQTRFTPDYVRGLFEAYPNLSYDLATGQPNRSYKCSGPYKNKKLKGDTVLWKGKPGKQKKKLKADYKSLMEDFSDRFVFATDYGGGRPPLDKQFRKKKENFDLITQELSDKARHNMGYRNAWKLLTGEAW